MFNLGPIELVILAAILLVGFAMVVGIGAILFILVQRAMTRR